MIWEMSPWQLFLLGGPVMWPILLCSVFSVAIVIEKALFFMSLREDVSGLRARIAEAIRRNDIKAAVALCDSSPSPTARVLRAGVLKYGRSREDIVEAMDEASQFELPRLERRIPALATIGNITPLLGLLGTVMGMMVAFHQIQMRTAAMNPVTPGDIAGGIWQALITTVAGLVVAIPTFVAHTYFLGRVNRHALRMERAATDILHVLVSPSPAAEERG